MYSLEVLSLHTSDTSRELANELGALGRLAVGLAEPDLLLLVMVLSWSVNYAFQD